MFIVTCIYLFRHESLSIFQHFVRNLLSVLDPSSLFKMLGNAFLTTLRFGKRHVSDTSQKLTQQKTGR